MVYSCNSYSWKWASCLWNGRYPGVFFKEGDSYFKKRRDWTYPCFPWRLLKVFYNAPKSIEKNDKIKIQVAQKIEKTKTELKKLQELYSAPKKLPGEIKIRLARKIQIKKEELKKLYSDPSSLITSKSAQRWVGIQVVKVFLGIPIVPGK